MREDDWFVKRFLLSRNRNVNAALNALCASLEWRKAENFRNLPDNYFPEEFYRAGGFFSYEPDLKGRSTLYIRVRFLLKCGLMNKYIKTFCEKVFYDADQEISEKGLTIVIDFDGAGLQNCEIDIAYHALHVLKTYFPGGLNLILMVDMPRVLRFGYALIKPLIPGRNRELMVFTNRKDIFNYIARENLPSFLGGTCSRPYNGYEVVPPGAPRCIEFGINVAKLDYNTCKDIYEMYKNALKDELELDSIEQLENIAPQVVKSQ